MTYTSRAENPKYDDAIETIESDNPCWGSPTKCGLRDLLQLISKDRSILFDSPRYVVLNKPPDLRMDGPYAATVHKLLNYWYPSPSLIEQCSSNTKAGWIDDLLLFERVSKIHQCNELKDNFLRHCHQLDYATSGILLVAKTQSAASHVSRLLEDRKVTKSYMAVVVGHLQLEKVPVWHGRSGGTVEAVYDEGMLRKHLQLLEKKYRKSRNKVNKQHNNKINGRTTKTTFPGFQPEHSLFQKWKVRMAKQSRDEDGIPSVPANKKQKTQKPLLLSDNDWDRIWEPVDTLVAKGLYTKEGWFKDLEWKKLGGDYRELKRAMTEATDLHNNILRQAMADNGNSIDRTNDKDISHLPSLFRLYGSEASACSCEFYVFCSLADNPDAFSMAIPPETVEQFPGMSTSTHPNDKTTYDFKPSLTKCRVLELGTYTHPDGTVAPITKVKLFPITGRRHQLRVHMALAGHSILGDMTYCWTSSSVTDRGRIATPWSRMCLHAHSLALPSLVGDSDGEWRVESPDPFPIRNGQLDLGRGTM